MPFCLTDGDRRRILSTILESFTRFSLLEGFGLISALCYGTGRITRPAICRLNLTLKKSSSWLVSSVLKFRSVFFWIDSALNLSLSLSIIKHERTIDTTYTHNNRGMLSYTYHAAFWVATKRRDVRGKETRTE